MTTCDVEAVPALQVAAEEISADELEEALREAEELRGEWNNPRPTER